MKFSPVKAAVAAAALAVAGVASAATSGDLMIEIFDAGSQKSFVADLGVTPFSSSSQTGTFALGTQFTDATNGWNAFLAGITGPVSSLQYMIVGGATRVGDIGFATLPTNATSSLSQLNAIFGATITTAMTNSMGTGTSAVLTSTSPASFSTLVGGGNNFQSLVPQGTVSTTQGTAETLGYFASGGVFSTLGTLNFNATTGTLTIGAVPEPGSYALMVAGLLAVGAIVRRRSRA